MTTTEKLLVANLIGEATIVGFIVQSHNKLIDERNVYLHWPKFHCYMGLRKKKEKRKWLEKVKEDEDWLKKFRESTEVNLETSRQLMNEDS